MHELNTLASFFVLSGVYVSIFYVWEWIFMEK